MCDSADHDHEHSTETEQAREHLERAPPRDYAFKSHDGHGRGGATDKPLPLRLLVQNARTMIGSAAPKLLSCRE